LLSHRAAADHDRPFVKCSAQWRTFGQVEDAAERLACGLARLGVGKGDRIGIISANRDELIDLVFACAKLGAVEVPFNTFLKGDFLSYQIADADLAAIVVDESGQRALAAVFGDVGVPTVIVLDAAGPVLPAARMLSFADLVNGPLARDPVEVTESDMLAILYTSGTTGNPKGCMLPHGQFLNAPKHHFDDERIIPGDRIFCAFPFFHGTAQVQAMMMSLTGPCSFILKQAFSASTFLREARAEGATRVLGVGAMAAAILAQPELPEDSDPGPIRSTHWIPCAEEDQLRFERRFRIPTWGEAFGQTETTAVCHTPLAGPRNRRSCGIPVPTFELAILDDDGYEVPRGTIGEIAVRPKLPNIMYQGYWRNPEASLAAMEHYWHHTGDYGRQDDQGFIIFDDRKKQAIRRRGENISSIEVENAIRKHPSIKDVAVHAVPSDMTEDEVKAVLVLRDGEIVEPGELFRFLRDNLPYFAVPRYIETRAALPVNAVGRVMKHLLKAEGVTPATLDFTAMGLVVGKDERRSLVPSGSWDVSGHPRRGGNRDHQAPQDQRAGLLRDITRREPAAWLVPADEPAHGGHQ
jgi:crotonobetaine/carnitine-CoA ligase